MAAAEPETMRAWEYDRYGRAEVLQLRSVAAPRPGRGELVVRVRAAALNPKDGLFRRGNYRLLSGRRFPKRTGCDFAGEVKDPGQTGLTVGDRVWGSLDEFRFLRGTLAEQVVARAVEVGRMPGSLSFEEAAGIPLAGQTSLQALRDVAALKQGDKVLIHGASGGVGVFAIQLARALGAGRITTTSSPKNFELCRGLGADETLDYADGAALSRTGAYRVLFDAVGNLSFGKVQRALASDGVYVSTVPSPSLAVALLRTALSAQRARLVVIRSRTADLDTLAAFVSQQRLRPVIDEVFPFEAAHPAFARLESRRARGKIILRLP